MNPAISFQVRTEGVVINLDPEKDFETIKQELIGHVKEADDFFSGVDIYLNISNHTFKMSHIKELMEILQGYDDVNDIYIFNPEKSDSGNNNISRKDTLLIKRTIRSGQRVKYPTNVVIVGDINPGAVVIAGGDIIVLGKLKGVVHAGADGTYDARIFALSLEPTQLRIANTISRSPDDTEKKNGFNPELAYLKKGKIIVEKFNI